MDDAILLSFPISVHHALLPRVEADRRETARPIASIGLAVSMK